MIGQIWYTLGPPSNPEKRDFTVLKNHSTRDAMPATQCKLKYVWGLERKVLQITHCGVEIYKKGESVGISYKICALMEN